MLIMEKHSWEIIMDSQAKIVTPKLALEKRFGDQITIDYCLDVGVVAPLEDAPTFTQIAAKRKKQM